MVDDIVTAIKSRTADEVRKFVMENLFNKRKEDEGLVSLTNTIVRDFLKTVNEWELKEEKN